MLQRGKKASMHPITFYGTKHLKQTRKRTRKKEKKTIRNILTALLILALTSEIKICGLYLVLLLNSIKCANGLTQNDPG